MKLHELKYTEGARRNSKRIGRGPAAESHWALKAARHRSGVVCRSVDSQTLPVRNSRLSTSNC